MIGRQLNLLLCAVQFLTRLPTPPLRGFEPDWITRSARYFPLVGLLVGGICALVLLAAGQVWDGWVPALLALGVGLLLTGGFHEDGLADSADGLGGGQTRERRLEIMKDSRVGTYGVLALVVVLGTKAATLATLAPAQAALALFAAHGIGRVAAVAVMAALPHVSDRADAKYKPAPDGVKPIEVLIAALLGLWPLLLAPPLGAVAAIGLAAVLALAPALLAKRLIGGYVGDVLGAVEQVAELGALLGLAAVLA
ncbi:adenosylcobinamide-GDP ribazoletransferase [Caulobacter endophyticus]|uniref:adenosylcobinamide-GDP ribazoletransferase n=1 Tax=Caulobacter endophyticus TaxID=2172652 RepID=UPI00240FC97C|nr:adenosylcobinamide-GDP ribazoletransferase [Caulobacter endophyticus]MDG2531417.1 adenosylcobinamide-GDP ribazoletransferase [Caulobacter endophyticus]